MGRPLLHGALWTAVVIALDIGTSWVMMSFRGVTSEGNPTMRLLFQNRDLNAIVEWAFQQYIYVDLILASVLSYGLLKYEDRIAPTWIRQTVFLTFYRVTIALTWFFALLRLSYGPPGNTISILLPYGEVVSLAGAVAVFTPFLWLMLSDMRAGQFMQRVLRVRKFS